MPAVQQPCQPNPAEKHASSPDDLEPRRRRPTRRQSIGSGFESLAAHSLAGQGFFEPVVVACVARTAAKYSSGPLST